MNKKSFLRDLLIANEQIATRKDELQGDFYFSIYSITIFVENSLRSRLSSKVIWQKYTIEFDREKIIKNIAGQVNLFLKENLLSNILVHELAIAKKAKLLEGNNTEDRFSYFIKEITNDKEWLDYCFEKYPLLLERLNIQIENILNYIVELISRIEADVDEIEKVFNKEIKHLSGLDLFLGDPHKNGKTVSIVNFNDGFRVVYKSRDLENELSFATFINFISSLGAHVDVGLPTIISKENYGWMEFINYEEFSSIQAIDNHYENIGKIICVFYILGTHDIMPDNIILSKNKPYFIDLECIMNRPLRDKTFKNSRGKYYESVISSGILPNWTQGNELGRDLIRSLFFSIKKQRIPSAVWINKNTDEFKQGNDHINPNSNDQYEMFIPQFNGEQFQLDYHFFNLLKEGFIKQYNFFVENSKEVINFFKGDYFDKTFIRYILHDTIVYDLILQESLIPEYFQGIESINPIVEKLLFLKEPEERKVLSDSIINQLHIGDIPYFFTKNCASNSLFSEDGKMIIENYFSQLHSGNAMIIDRLFNLSNEDMKYQLNIIDITCKCSFEFFDIKFPIEREFIQMKNIKENLIKQDIEGIEKDELLNISIKIGESILEKAYFNKDSSEYDWIWKNRGLDGKWGCVSLNLDLYDGISGMAFFYLYLYKYSQELKFKNAAITILGQLKREFLRLEKEYLSLGSDSIKNYPLSAFSFPSSLIFLTEHFNYVLEEDFRDLKIYNSFLSIIDKFLISSENLDLLMGQAGLLELLMGLPDTDDVKKIKKKIVSNIYLLTDKQEDNSIGYGFIDPYLETKNKAFLGGFAHGSAGISSVIFKYGITENDEVAMLLGDRLLKHDRNQYDENIKGWKDGRGNENNDDAGCWCHGSAGIALSRLIIDEFSDDRIIEWELKVAQENIKKTGIGSNQSLCHGDMGNLEVLRSIANRLEDTATKKFIEIYLKELIDQYKLGKSFKTGDEAKVPLINLFMGEAGIAYGFLRHYDWENTPSLLALEMPNKLYKNLH